MVSANFASAGEHLPNMSQLARAFTTIGRRNKRSIDDDASSSSSSPFIGRAASQRGGRIVNLTDISSPLALITTSNIQVHNAKHIAGTNEIAIHHVGTDPVSTSSSSSSVSGDESDNATVVSVQDGGALTDASSVDESPMLEPNHLSCYFKPSVNTAAAAGSGLRRSRSSTLSSTGYGAAASAPSSPTLSDTAEETFDNSNSNSADNTPRIPQRVPSHSKRAHERVHRTRSLQRSISVVAGTSTPTSPGGRRSGLGRSSSTNSIRASTTTSSSSILAFSDSSKALQSATGGSTSSSSSALPSLFGNELGQLDEEVAEEFDFVTRKVEAEMAAEAAEEAAERAQLAERGLAVWDAAVYCGEIAELVEETFGVWAGHVDVGVMEMTWF